MESSDTTTTESGLQYKDLLVGEGEAARAGATAIVHYTGWLLDGTKFDSSLDRGTPFEFLLGRGQVIQGWDEASLYKRSRRSALPLRIFVLSSADRGIVGIQSMAGWFKTKG